MNNKNKITISNLNSSVKGLKNLLEAYLIQQKEEDKVQQESLFYAEGFSNYPTFAVYLCIDSAWDDVSTLRDIVRYAFSNECKDNPISVIAEYYKSHFDFQYDPNGFTIHEEILAWAMTQVNYEEIVERRLDRLMERYLQKKKLEW
jgi:hypothetical protein